MVGYGLKEMLELTAANRKIHIYFQINFELDSLCLKQVCYVNLALYKSCCICIFVFFLFFVLPLNAFENYHVNCLGKARQRHHLHLPLLVGVLKEMFRRLIDHLAFFFISFLSFCL